MSFASFITNIHFTVEILGALAFFAVAWLAFDALRIRRDFITASRGVGFLLLGGAQIFSAFLADPDLALAAAGVYLLGVIFVVWNLALEWPAPRPEFKSLMMLPLAGSAALSVGGATAIGLLAATFLALRQYRVELKKSLLPFAVGFLFLSLGAIASLWYAPDEPDALWIAGHLAELAGFAAILKWVWNYLQLRIREELLLIFVLTSLFISVVVTLTFSTILVSRVEDQTKADLATNARVLELAIGRLQAEALAKAELVSRNEALASALQKNDFVAMEALLGAIAKDQKLGFLLVADANGDVVLRAHALTQKGDAVSGERAASAALEGAASVTIERGAGEGFSIRAAAPLTVKNKVIGAVVAGFQLDNALVDSVKRITGLDASIFERTTRVASTVTAADGLTRSVGVIEADERVTGAVMQRGEALTVSTRILSRPAIASYLPLKNADGAVVGMIAATRHQQEITALADATNRLTLVVVIALMLVLTMPMYVVTRRLAQEIK